MKLIKIKVLVKCHGRRARFFFYERGAGGGKKFDGGVRFGFLRKVLSKRGFNTHVGYNRVSGRRATESSTVSSYRETHQSATLRSYVPRTRRGSYPSASHDTSSLTSPSGFLQNSSTCFALIGPMSMPATCAATAIIRGKTAGRSSFSNYMVKYQSSLLAVSLSTSSFFILIDSH